MRRAVPLWLFLALATGPVVRRTQPRLQARQLEPIVHHQLSNVSERKPHSKIGGFEG
jgi:hypothetical protein